MRLRRVSLPLIHPIDSRRPPDVLVMESTHTWDRHHPASARRLHSARRLPHGELPPKHQVLERQLAVRAKTASQCPAEDSEPSDHDREIADQSAECKFIAPDTQRSMRHGTSTYWIDLK